MATESTIDITSTAPDKSPPLQSWPGRQRQRSRARVDVGESTPLDLCAASQLQLPLQTQFVSPTDGNTCEGVRVRVVPTDDCLPREVPTDFRSRRIRGRWERVGSTNGNVPVLPRT